MPKNRLLKRLLFDTIKGLCPPGRPRSNLNHVALRDCQICRYVIVKSVKLVGLTEMHKTERFGETTLVLPYLAHHELECTVNIVVVVFKHMLACKHEAIGHDDCEAITFEARECARHMSECCTLLLFIMQAAPPRKQLSYTCLPWAHVFQCCSIRKSCSLFPVASCGLLQQVSFGPRV